MSNDTKNRPDMDQSRRSFMKLTITGLLAGAAMQLMPGLSTTSAAEKGGQGKKILVVYYSRSGNTRDMANQIHVMVGGDIVELQTVTPYPFEHRATTEQARRELDSGYKPPLTTEITGLASYDVIFVGSPSWWGSYAAPVKTFLSDFDFSGKTLVPFITHEGSGLGHAPADMAKLCPGATFLKGLAVRGGSVKTAHKDVESWLRGIGIKK